MNSQKLAIGFVLICVGTYASIMGIFMADGRGIFDPVCVVSISCGFASFVAGLTIAIVAGTETTQLRKRP